MRAQLDRAFFDLSARAKFRVFGPDRFRFLNGQITNDVGKAGPTHALAACALSAKGRINAHFFVSARSDDFLLDADSELRDLIAPRLERYIIADDVGIEDVTEEFSIFHVLGLLPQGLPEDCRIITSDRFGRPGTDIWVKSAGHHQLLDHLSSTLPLCDAVCTEVLRIEQGIPKWGHELSDEIIPVEAGLEESCVDYEKGCYIGQEVISRMKMSGQRSKTLCGLISLEDLPLAVGMKLFATEEKTKEVGQITSATRSENLQKEIGLGYVKRGFNEPGAILHGSASENEGTSLVRIQVVALPFLQAAVGKN